MVSVCMAVFNGEKYLKEQLDSIILQLKENDEIIVSLDESLDSSPEILKKYSEKDGRVKIFKGLNKGVIKNFENAVNMSTGDFIFLCDQDDVWTEGKVFTVLEEFNKGESIDLIVHDGVVVDENLKEIYPSIFEKNGSRKGKFKNILKNSYVGCCMAFRKSLKEHMLPFPKDLPMHDQWIGLVAELKGNVKFLKKSLIKYRRHGFNTTCMQHSSFFNMLKWRANVIKDLILYAR